MYNSTQLAPRVTAVRMTRALAATDWMDQAQDEFPTDPAYEAWLEAELEWDRTHCCAHYTTGGSDPWGFTCDLAKDHSGDHSMTNPMGPDTPTFTWKRGH